VNPASSEYFHSTTFVPVTTKQLEEEMSYRKEDRSKWRGREGWIFPDVKTTMQCNEHPRKLDKASLDKLSEPWQENELHVYKQKSPLDYRIYYKHDQRDKDFNNWSQPKRSGDNQFPITIFDAGDVKDQLKKEVELYESNCSSFYNSISLLILNIFFFEELRRKNGKVK
jgi:hypothetical protein